MVMIGCALGQRRSTGVVMCTAVIQESRTYSGSSDVPGCPCLSGAKPRRGALNSGNAQ